MTGALHLAAAILWWAMLWTAAVLVGVSLLFAWVTVHDWWRDRDACQRIQQLDKLQGPRPRTLDSDLERVWGLPCAPDRDPRVDRLALWAAEVDIRRNLPTTTGRR